MLDQLPPMTITTTKGSIYLVVGVLVLMFLLFRAMASSPDSLEANNKYAGGFGLVVDIVLFGTIIAVILSFL